MALHTMARLWPQPPVCSHRGYSTDADLTIARAHASRVPERCDKSARRRGCGLGMGRVARRWPPTSASRDGVDALFVAADASCVCEGRRFAAAIRLAHHFRMTRGLDRPRTHTSTAHARAAAGVGASGAPLGKKRVRVGKTSRVCLYLVACSARGRWVGGAAGFARARVSCVCRRGARQATWLILPVVICLSQRLSHACLSISDLYCETANGSLNQLWFI